MERQGAGWRLEGWAEPRVGEIILFLFRPTMRVEKMMK
jgi:hypothetical protein